MENQFPKYEQKRGNSLTSRIFGITLIIISLILLLFVIFGICFSLSWTGKILFDSSKELLINILIVLGGIILLIVGILILKRKK